ncbi:unnamed protein product [Rotaria sp. Silwood2]|nr:unnamed protein product [Rotaria sp. Silwood2]CAF3251432.1 unnamed protein product [Rotaria sp. Silwood2]CAF3523526.1 unnamed protein product [Rotaria sp. Silwood2]CAF4579626.1 unnamed protein product [Rotaria sp. Silwood2]CAF4655116.1 unnamed protein product [Rotaria sp. Silwood2]
MKYLWQMVNLYNGVRKTNGNSDAFPYISIFEYELLPGIKALQLMEQSIQSYLNHQSSSIAPLTTIKEFSSDLSPLTIQIGQIERQISDKSFCSVRNKKKQQQATGIYNHNSPLLT